MGDSRYWEPIFKVDIVNSSGALSFSKCRT
jgi:hypothetical protein